jgi:hypothetical protein
MAYSLTVRFLYIFGALLPIATIVPEMYVAELQKLHKLGGQSNDLLSKV